MKNKLEVNFVTSEQLVDDLSVNTVEQKSKTKANPRRESRKPKIVICPPAEEMSEEMTTPRASRLLKTIRNRISRRPTDSGSLGSSSSSDSVSGDGNGRTDDRSSNSVSESDSEDSGRNRRHRSTVSLRRVFQSLNLTSRSSSSAATDRPRQQKKQKQPKRILRPPITYTYVRGLSGLPTQRVPRYAVTCNSMGLNR